MTDIGLGSWPRRRARISGDAVAFTMDRRQLTYDELDARVEALAAGLAGLGVRRGDRVAYLGANDIATFESLFAAGRLGAVLVPLNTRLSAVEVGYMLSDCTPRVLLVGKDSLSLAMAAEPRSRGVDRVIAVDDPDTGQADGYAALTRRTVGASPRQAVIGLADPALILYTSGTTGRAKGAILTHGNLTFNTFNQLAHTDVLSTDTVACTAPLFHVVGLGQVTLPTLFKGGCVHVMSKFDPVLLIEAIAARGINAFSAVPTMLQMLCEHPSFAGADLTSLRYVVYGGSPANERVASIWLERGVRLLHGYGLTEASPGVLLATQDGARRRRVSAGTPPFYPDLGLRDEAGRVWEDPERDGNVRTGELLVRGPNVFSGYLDRDDETALATRDGWLNTGDIAQFDHGWGVIVDRAKDMFISGGENVYPAEVESIIAEMAGISDCAVVGVADERWGEVGAAAIVRRNGKTPSEHQIRLHLQRRLARFKAPKRIVFLENLPRNANGKVAKNDLRLLFEEQPEDLGVGLG